MSDDDDREPTRAELAKELLRRLTHRRPPAADGDDAEPTDPAPEVVAFQQAAAHIKPPMSIPDLVKVGAMGPRTAQAVLERQQYRAAAEIDCDLCGDPVYARHRGRDLCRDCFEDETEDDDDTPPE